MIEQNSDSYEFIHSPNLPSHQHSVAKIDKSPKTKNIQKAKGKSKISKSPSDQSESQLQNLTKEQKKEIQKQKNRVAAQLSRDRQKKYVEDLQMRVKDLEKLLQDRVCRKCKAKLQEYSTSQDENSMSQYQGQERGILHNSTQDLLNQQPEIEPLPFIRVPFQKSDLGFGKIGSFFCISLLVLALFCFSSSIEGAETSANTVNQEHRLMQAVSDYCTLPQVPIQKPTLSNINVPSTLNYGSNWLFKSERNGDSLDSTKKCKTQFWQDYLDLAREQVSNLNSKNLLNCNSPTLIRITDPRIQEQNMTQKWTFLISDPAITHAHFQDSGQFYVDEVDYLDGVYQMVAEKVVLTKVIGKNCLA